MTSYRFRGSEIRNPGPPLISALLPLLSFLFLLGPAFAETGPEIHGVGANGVPSFMTGPLGRIDAADRVGPKGGGEELLGRSAQGVLLDVLIEHFGARGTEEMEVVRVRQDEIGKVHVRFQQRLNGLAVVGAQMYLHAEAETGEVYAVNGELAPDVDVPLPEAAVEFPAEALLRWTGAGLDGDVAGVPEKLYFHDAESGRTHLAWKVRVNGVEGGRFFDDDVYVDALTFEVVAVDGHVKTARRRFTYDATGSVIDEDGNVSGLPGELRCTETNTRCGEPAAQRAHDGAGGVYDYYRTRFGRDSLNGNGGTLGSSVHVGQNLNNAFYFDGHMYYGDGDGRRWRDLTLSFDVIAHEFTHGVTDFESNLLYQKESGALNEALSDIFGVAADTFSRRGVVSSATWKMGEAAFTPGISGDAVRYMNDPERDGVSRSYYPERHYPGACTPSEDNDRCGVHLNSGIANLAFYLMVQGGRHPRGKTSVSVPAIGMAKAERIFYRAQTSCLTSGSNFQSARNCTAQAAQDLYGASDRAAVYKAWDAVGVGGGSGDGGGGGELANGVARTGLRGAAGSRTFFFINVPAGATNLTFRLSGGSGDADLYVRRGSRPTTTTYSCRSWSTGTSEACSFASPQAGTYHVMVYGYQSYSGVRLVASFSRSSGACRGSGEAANLSASSGEQLFYTFEVDACASRAIFTLSGGSGDADLYVRRGARPSTTTYECRSVSADSSERCVLQRAQAGTYYILVDAYSSFSGVTLKARYE